MNDIVITGKENIHFAMGLTCASALALEISTGLKISRHGSAIQGAQIQGFIPKGKRTTKKAALKAVVKELKRLRPEYVPNSTVQKALDS